MLPSHSLDARGGQGGISALDVANCTITILVAGAGWHRRWLAPASCSLPSVFVTVPVLCTLADALKARQTEYYTNTHLRRPSAVPSASSPLPPPPACHTLSSNYQTLPRSLSLSFLQLRRRLRRSVRLFLFRNQPPKGRHLSPRMFRLPGETGKGGGDGFRRSRDGETNAPLRDFAFKEFPTIPRMNVSLAAYSSLNRGDETRVRILSENLVSTPGYRLRSSRGATIHRKR